MCVVFLSSKCLHQFRRLYLRRTLELSWKPPQKVSLHLETLHHLGFANSFSWKKYKDVSFIMTSDPNIYPQFSDSFPMTFLHFQYSPHTWPVCQLRKCTTQVFCSGWEYWRAAPATALRTQSWDCRPLLAIDWAHQAADAGPFPRDTGLFQQLWLKASL